MTFEPQFNGVPRAELERLAAEAIRDRDTYQARCTELLEEVRRLKGNGL